MDRSYTRNLVHSHPVFSKKCTFSMPISKARQEGLKKLFALAEHAQRRGWAPEALLRSEVQRREKALRQKESRRRKPR